MQAYATPETGLSPQLRLVNSSASMSASPSIGQGHHVLDLLLKQLADSLRIA